MDVILESVREAYVRAAFEGGGTVALEFSEALAAVFRTLAAAPRVLWVRAESPENRTLVTFHDSEHTPWLDVSGRPGVVAALREIIETDGELTTSRRLSRGHGTLVPDRCVIEVRCGPAVAARVDAAYEPARWALPLLAHVFDDPRDWTLADHEHAANVLHHALSTPEAREFPASHAVATRLAGFEEMGASEWRALLLLLRSP